jgi:hypothetical protein
MARKPKTVEPLDAFVDRLHREIDDRRNLPPDVARGGPLTSQQVREVEERVLAHRIQKRDPHVGGERARQYAKQGLAAMSAETRKYKLREAFGLSEDPLTYVPRHHRPGPAPGTTVTFQTEDQFLADYLRVGQGAILNRKAYEELSGISHQTITDTMRRLGLSWAAVQSRATKPKQLRREKSD